MGLSRKELLNLLGAPEDLKPGQSVYVKSNYARALPAEKAGPEDETAQPPANENAKAFEFGGYWVLVRMASSEGRGEVLEARVGHWYQTAGVAQPKIGEEPLFSLRAEERPGGHWELGEVRMLNAPLDPTEPNWDWIFATFQACGAYVKGSQPINIAQMHLSTRSGNFKPFAKAPVILADGERSLTDSGKCREKPVGFDIGESNVFRLPKPFFNGPSLDCA